MRGNGAWIGKEVGDEGIGRTSPCPIPLSLSISSPSLPLLPNPLEHVHRLISPYLFSSIDFSHLLLYLEVFELCFSLLPDPFLSPLIARVYIFIIVEFVKEALWVLFVVL